MALVASGARPAGAPDFTYREFPGWDAATRDQLDALDLLVSTILQPARSALRVPLTITSWLRPQQGSSIHPLGAAADVVAGNPPTREATFNLWLWLARSGIPVGELLYEQPKTGATGHVHVTLPGYGGRGEIMYQQDGGDGRLLHVDPFSLAVLGTSPAGRAGEPGSETNPYELPGIDVVVSRWGWLWPWLVVGGVVYAAAAGGRRRRS